MVILVDCRTECIGEIFAAALHERGTAMLVGATTAGNVGWSRVHRPHAVCRWRISRTLGRDRVQ